MADGRRTRAWAALHAAVGDYCAATGASEDHHRAVVDDLRKEAEPDWAWFQEYFSFRARVQREHDRQMQFGAEGAEAA